MKFTKDWLPKQIQKAKDDVELWPIHQQEYMCYGPLSTEQKIERTKIRIKRLREEIAKEEINLINLSRKVE